LGLPILIVLLRPRAGHGDKPVPALDAGSQRSRQHWQSLKSRQALFPA